ncbi:hypothetical protein SNE40_020144 [Patella caerulea]|uniref:Methylcytosine dioxygenase TET n=1 Tax=Patella caerulea TaxID=87958 RepID=A0AAN8G6T5_PATCE
MDLDGAKQDTGWRSGSEASQWQQFLPYGQPPAYGYSSLPGQLSAAGEPVVADLLTNRAAVSQLFQPGKFHGSHKDGFHSSMPRSLPLSHGSNSSEGMRYQHNINTIIPRSGQYPGQSHLPHGLSNDLARSVSLTQIDTKTTSIHSWKDIPGMKSSSSLENLNYGGSLATHQMYGPNVTSTSSPNHTRSSTEHKQFPQNMMDTSAINLLHSSSSYQPFSDIPQHKLFNYNTNGALMNGAMDAFNKNRAMSSESINSNPSSRGSLHSLVDNSIDDTENRPTVSHRDIGLNNFSPSGTSDSISQPLTAANVSKSSSRPASRSWSPWDNMIRSTNNSPATVQSTSSSSQPPSPIINYSPVQSPFSSSTSSIGLASSLGSAVPGSPVLPPSSEEIQKLKQQQSKDPFNFQNEINEFKPPDSLPKPSKPAKKKSIGKLKECRRKRGVLPFPDVSLDEINPELARMIRESKAKEDSKPKKQTHSSGDKKVKSLSAPLPNPPTLSSSPIDKISPFLNQQIKSVMKPTSPYEFTDDQDTFSPGVLQDTFNASINVNSKMYSMSEMLSMTNSRSDAVDTKNEAQNGELKVKKKKRKKTVEKMLSSSNILENSYPVFPNSNTNSNDINLTHSPFQGNFKNSASTVDQNKMNIGIQPQHLSTNLNSDLFLSKNLPVTSSNKVHNVITDPLSSGSCNLERPIVTPYYSSQIPQQSDQSSIRTGESELSTPSSLSNSGTLSGISQEKNKHSQATNLNVNQNDVLCCTDCKSHGAISPNCQNRVHHHYGDIRSTISHSNENINNSHFSSSQNVQQFMAANLHVENGPSINNSAITHLKDERKILNVLKKDCFESTIKDNVNFPKFSSPIIKSENCEMDLEQYLSSCKEPTTEGALLNNLEASINSLFTKTFVHENQGKTSQHVPESSGQLKRSSSWHDIHDMSMNKNVNNKVGKKNPLIDPNIIRPTGVTKQPKVKKPKLHGANGLTKPPLVPPGPFATPEEERLDRLKNNRPEIPNCNCLPNEMINEVEEGPYYTQLGSGKSIQSVREQLEKQTGVSGTALRIEKIVYTGKEGKSSQGCPIAKWIIRRSGPEEKYLCVVKHRKQHFCDATFIVVVLVAWEGVPSDTANDLYSHLVGSLTKNGFETDRRCGTNEKKTCACQGVDLVRKGASFSFGCSWSMYFNGCKFARSREVRKFKLKDTSKEEELDAKLQSLASVVGPLYETVAPKAHGNQCEFKDGKECRLGENELKPFSGVTACVDFCAHAHKDLHNMNNGSTVVVTLTKHRGFNKPDDEQLHVLPLYTLDPTDENGSYDNQMEKVRSGALEVLHNFPHEVRMRAHPLTPKKKGRNAKKDQSPSSKKDANNALGKMKGNIPVYNPNGKLSKNNHYKLGKIPNSDKNCSYPAPTKSENKDNLTFDNLMSLSDMPGFTEMYDSFWSFFYKNGSFPPANFLDKWGATLPSSNIANIKGDVNSPSNTIIQKPSSDMYPGSNHPKSNAERQQPLNFDNQMRNLPPNFQKASNMEKQDPHNTARPYPYQGKDANSAQLNQNDSLELKNLQSNLPGQIQGSYNQSNKTQHDLNSFHKNKFQEQQQNDGKMMSVDNMFKVPMAPDNINFQQTNHNIGGNINNPFRSPDSHHQQKTDYMQRPPQHPINSLAKTKRNGPTPPASPNFSGYSPFDNKFNNNMITPHTPSHVNDSDNILQRATNIHRQQSVDMHQQKSANTHQQQQMANIHTPHRTSAIYPSDIHNQQATNQNFQQTSNIYPQHSADMYHQQSVNTHLQQSSNIPQQLPVNVQQQPVIQHHPQEAANVHHQQRAIHHQPLLANIQQQQPANIHQQQTSIQTQQIDKSQQQQAIHKQLQSEISHSVKNQQQSTNNHTQPATDIHQQHRSDYVYQQQASQNHLRQLDIDNKKIFHNNGQKTFIKQEALHNNHPQMGINNKQQEHPNVHRNQDSSGSFQAGFLDKNHQSDNQRLSGDWPAAKRQCLSNNQTNIDDSMYSNLTSRPNDLVHNQNPLSCGANFTNNIQNCVSGANNVVPQIRNYPVDLQKMPLNQGDQLSDHRNNSGINNNQILPQQQITPGQHNFHPGSNSQYIDSSKQSFESPLHMPYDATRSYPNHPMFSVTHPENRANTSLPDFNSLVPCEQNNSHRTLHSQEQHQISMQNPSQVLHQDNHSMNRNNQQNNQHHSPSMLNLEDGKFTGCMPNAEKKNPDEPEEILDPTVVHRQMEYNEESFHDPDVGGVAIALSHGAVLFEVAKRELHATTALKNPNRYHPTRISLVFYQHKNLNYSNHGFLEYEMKCEKLRLQKLEKRKESMENGDIIPEEIKIKKKSKKGGDEEEIDFATTSAAQYKYMWEAPVSHSEALTTDSIITRWIDPQPMVTGPYQRWVLPSC